MFGEVGEKHGQGVGIGLFWVLAIPSQLLSCSQSATARTTVAKWDDRAGPQWLSGTTGRALTYTYPIQDNLQKLIIGRQLLQEFEVSATGQIDEDGDGIFGDRLKQPSGSVSTCSPEAHGLRR